MLSLNERSKNIRKKSWNEVSVVMKGSFTSTGAKQTFKCLVDIYKSIIRSEKCSTGSALKNTGDKWAHYCSIEFLEDYITPKPNISNSESNSSQSNFGAGRKKTMS